jgi:N-acetyl-anhydromuramyl-L-alanine amidase AmpD
MSPAAASAPAVRRWRSINRWIGRPYGPPIAFVLHTESGGESGTVAEFLSSSSQFSSHYTAALDGTLSCFVDPTDRAWANGILEYGNRWMDVAAECGVDPALNPNQVTISCETEDRGDLCQPVTDGQYRAVLYAAREAKRRYPTSLKYLLRHADISPQSRANCPGDRWTASGRFKALADELGFRTVSE